MKPDNHTELIMLGTGNAGVTRCYNTCFALNHDGNVLLVDAGGGNGILMQLEKAGIAIGQIHEMFVTHAHTDHILGVIWVIRTIAQLMNQGLYQGSFKMFSHDKVIQVVDWICRMTLPKKIVACLGNGIEFCEVKDGECFDAADFKLQCFDIASTKEKQFGFQAILPDGQKLVCLGDEPFNESNRHYVEGADWLLSEAFCLYEDRERFKPYEKHHSTALDAGRLADKLNVKNLLLYHTEDKTLDTRKEKYTKEVAANYHGRIWVPDDLERIEL
ncbi:MBL fold metallo-hydrolase [uncultured Bacteroides sp.]|uniref:MBL fold metallo-hydrolase n=1 Tax=uncultured Bacteroides sp. TaxID=162156 RepID=UPI0026221928|nr:MBL fold metallo-hydrolase [uncultured Bacteroides sp.]